MKETIELIKNIKDGPSLQDALDSINCIANKDNAGILAKEVYGKILELKGVTLQ